MALGSTQPLTEVCRLGRKGGRCVGLTTLTPSCADFHEICEPQTPGTLRTCPGPYRVSLTFTQLGQALLLSVDISPWPVLPAITVVAASVWRSSLNQWLQIFCFGFGKR
jgi:hypothetical protein